MQPLHVRPAKGVRFAFALLVWLTLLSLQCLSALGTSSLRAAEAGTSKGMQEFPVPCERCNPNSLVLDDGGSVWFTEMGMFFRGRFANKVGKLTP